MPSHSLSLKLDDEPSKATKATLIVDDEDAGVNYEFTAKKVKGNNNLNIYCAGYGLGSVGQ